MAREIDTRIVEMEFDNKQFESGIKETQRSLEDLKKSLDLDGAGKGLQEIESQSKKLNFDSITSALDTLGSKFTALGTIGIGALTKIGETAAQMGMNLVKSLTIDPISSGFSEYQQKADSIKVTMANTGESLQTVKDALEELNLYADKTIYSFSDMTKSIGLFTAQGIELQTATKAIQGISNLAAVTGADSEKASRAMFNFAQALSVGKMQLIDWKTMMNTGMGNERFRQEVIQVAKDLGYLNKTFEYGNNQTISGIDALEEATVSFADTLKYGWFDNDVMLEVLRRYADESTEIGALAYQSAVEVNTFAKMIDALGESVQSGWAMTWEYIFGDYEQATQLWTSINNVVGDYLNQQANARNETLKTWNELGGRTDLIEGFKNIFSGLATVIEPITNAIEKVFPPISGQTLADMTSKFREFTTGIQLSESAQRNLGSVVEFVATGVHKFGDIILAVTKGLSPLLEGLNRIANIALSVAGAIATLGTNFLNAVVTTENLEKVTNLLRTSLTGFGTVALRAFETLIDAISKLHFSMETGLTGTKEFVETLLSGFSELAEDVPVIFAPVTEVIDSILDKLGFVGDVVKAAIAGVKSLLDNWDVDEGYFDNFRNMFKKLISGQSFSEFFEDLGDAVGFLKDRFLDLLAGMGPVGSALAKVIGPLLTPLKELVSWMKNELLSMSFDDIKDAALVIFLGQFVQTVKKFIDDFGGLSESLSGAIRKVGDGLADTLNAYQNQIKAKTVKEIAGALVIFAAALGVLALIPRDELVKAGVAITAALTELLVATAIINKITSAEDAFKNVSGFNMTMLKIASAILVMAAAVKKIGSMDLEGVAKGVGGVTILMADIAAFAGVMSALKVESFTKGSTQLILLAAALNMMVSPVKKLGEMDLQTLVKGLGSLGAVIAELSVFMLALSKTSGGDVLKASTGIVALSASLHVFAAAFEKFQEIKIEGIITGLTTLGVVLAEVAIASNLTNGSIGASSLQILALAAAVNILVPPMKELGTMPLGDIVKAILALAAALGGLAALSALLGPFSAGVMALGGAIAALGIGMAAASASILLFGKGLTAVAEAIETFGSVSAESIHNFVDNVIELIGTLLTALPSLKLKIVKAGAELLLGLVEIVEEVGPDIVHGVLVIVDEILELLEEYSPKISQSAVAILVAVVDEIDKKAGELGEKLGHALISLIGGAVLGIKRWFDEQVPGWALWIHDKVIAPIGEAVTNGLNMAKEAEEAGGYTLDGYQKGMTDTKKLKSIYDAGVRMGKEAIEGLEDTLIINSPSEVMEGDGEFTAEGYRIGVEKGVAKETPKVKSVWGQLLEDIKGVLVDKGGNIGTTVAETVSAAFQNTTTDETESLTEALGSAFTEAGTSSVDTLSTTVQNETKKATSSMGDSLKEAGEEVAKQFEDGLIEGLDLNAVAEMYGEETAELLIDTFNDLTEELEEIAAERAERIANIFSEELSRQKYEQETYNLEYKLWSAKNPNASEYEKAKKQMELYEQELYIYRDNLMYAKGNYEAAIQEFGATSDEAREHYQNSIQAEIDFYEKANQMTDLQTKYNDEQKKKADEYYDFIQQHLEDVNETYATMEDLYQAAKEHSGYDPEEYWGELTTDVESIVQRSLEIVDLYYKAETQKKMDEVNQEFIAVGEEAVLGMMEGIEDQEPELKSKMLAAAEAAAKEALGAKSSYTAAGKDFIDVMSEGIKSNSRTAQTAAKQVSDDGAHAISMSYGAWEDAGENVGRGFASGITQSTGQAVAAAQRMANAVAAVTSTTLRMHSPSRVFADFGRFVDLGFASGISDNAGIVTNAMRYVNDDMLKNTKETISAVLYEMEQAEKFAPVVKPTLDLTDIQNGTERMRKILSQEPDLVAKVGGISADVKEAQTAKATPPQEINNVTNNYDMTQNNYSPKALSTYDIYRQTRNQFSRIKEKTKL